MTELTPQEHIRRLKPPTPRTLLLVVAVLAVLFLLYLARGGLAPFAIGIVLVYALSPLVRWLAKKGWNPIITALLSIVVLVVAVVGLTILILDPLIQQLTAYLKALPTFIANAQATIESLPIPAPIQEVFVKALVVVQSVQAGFTLSSIVPAAQTVLGAFAFLVSLAVVPFFTFYVLKDAGKLEPAVSGVIPEVWRGDVVSSAKIFNDRVGSYIRGIAVESLVMSIMVFASIMLLGVIVDPAFYQYALFLAIIAGIMEVLPMIGIFIAVIPALLIAFTLGPSAVIGVVIVYAILSQVEGSIVTPKVQNAAVDLHPALVMMAIILGFHVAGIVGALLSIPFLVAGRDIVSYLYLRLGDDPPTADDAVAQFVKPRAPIRFRSPKGTTEPVEGQA